ncbi:hypothetical protein RAZWK3B_04992 [Roseobacter sp. AzwK-3b]|nr:hypothetical protein RAZWK3B_04992 [Roseobacter sp. AzwK-3b]
MLQSCAAPRANQDNSCAPLDRIFFAEKNHLGKFANFLGPQAADHANLP